MRSAMPLPPTTTTWEIVMHEELSQVGFPELMTEVELMCFLRIRDVSHGAHPHNVVVRSNHHRPGTGTNYNRI